ncbi:hypothetical protein [Mesorhizobium sp. B2-4-6]|uniref:hypothetical protein n=1 Tax=Mesorhizobium sp. B2-4-6 TaxID=2589943 RepID=UPI00112C3446|nr:hypothetical protein [Mesorhizobium sp. B2-4-6]TPL40650.1 hypothetical protein FJ957_25815 [Mesorhizobium sp. B2-4-6]
MPSIKDAPVGMLRAWADAKVISSARYVEEMERRRGLRAVGEPMPIRVRVEAPPLDYALDDELAIPGIDVLDFAGDHEPSGPVPAPSLAVWVVGGIAAGLIVVALAMVLP